MSNINETPGEIANRVAFEALKAENELMRRLYSVKGFCSYWSDQLKNFDYNTKNGAMECYNKAEDLHEKLFGVRKFSCYQHFCRARSKIYKPKRL